MQCNSIRVGLEKMVNVDARIVAAILFAGVVYIMLGGAKRIVKVSDAIVPFKVGLFFVTAFIALVYHWQTLLPALKTMLVGAFNPQALLGGLAGFTVQDAIRFGMSRSLNATEAGLGTAGVLFGSTGSKYPVRDGILSMVATFISYYLVCFVIMWLIIASGVWNSGLTSTALTISAFQTVFGRWGGWVVTGLSIIFGLGVLVAYAYIGRECWRFLTGNRWLGVYSTLYCLMALYGTLAQVGVVWGAIDMVNAGMMAINLFAIAWLLPEIKRGLDRYKKEQKAQS
jgi:AGCS family alanine or glycine:cation symporter